MRAVVVDRVLRCLRWAFFFIAAWHVTASAEPFRPEADDTVIAPLPLAPPTLESNADPDPEAAAQQAGQLLERSRRHSDARLLGHAQALLAPWWDLPAPPPPVRVIRGLLRQAMHEDRAALADLDAALADNPDHAQAWLARALAHRRLGEYDTALASCRRLEDGVAEVAGAICRWSIEGLNGNLVEARSAFADLRSRAINQPPAVAAWYFAERADAEVRAGDETAARRIYEAGLRRFQGDVDLRAGLADLLLEQEAYAEVFALIDDDTEALTLRLRLALAAMALNDVSLQRLDPEMREAFRIARLRGERWQLRDEVRYRLAAGERIQRVLPLAQDNWKHQRTPWDARLLIDCANRAGDSGLARPVEQWLRDTGLQDVRIPPVARP